jgi:hypothetical protein
MSSESGNKGRQVRFQGRTRFVAPGTLPERWQDHLILSEVRSDGAEGQNRTAYAGLFRAALYR